MSSADWDEDGDDDDDEPMMVCPYCRAEMLESALQCPSCGQYISEEDRPAARRPLWLVVVAILCLAGLVFGLLQ